MGNILSYLQNDTTFGSNSLALDSVNYSYYRNTSRLNHVNDTVTDAYYAVDIDDQQATLDA